jgi:tRNA A37 threonylcarbamoyladenosine modification protein TsaB
MNLLISLDDNKITLTLKNGRKIIDSLVWTDQYTLSEKLLINIDKLLKKNVISVKDLKKVSSKVSGATSVTSIRIIKTAEKALNIEV